MSDVAARLADTAARVPDRPALVWQDRTVTYGELDRRATNGAGALQHLGVVRGDRVALLIGNTPHFAEAHFAALRAGATVVPLTLGLAPDEIAHALADAGARAVVVSSAAVQDVVSVRDRLPELEHVIVAGGTEVPDGATSSWRSLVKEEHPYEPVDRSLDDLAALVYTSGTTGRPRGAMLTRRNLVVNQDQSLAGRFKIQEDDVVLLVLPLSHIYALNVGLGACVHVGATMVLVERFAPVATLDAIVEHGVSIILGAPPMYIAWLNTPGTERYDLGSVRLAVSGAAPLPRQVLQRFQHEFAITIEEGYGLTEASPSVTSNAMAAVPRAGSVGKPLPDLELRLVDDEGNDVALGDPGEVLVRGPNVFVGYYNDEEATREALSADGWLHTGDIGVFDEDGYLYLVDRKKDLIIVSGFNVYPREVERVLYDHPAVAECAVVGVPHPYTGEAVKAFVVPVPGEEVSEDELTRFCGRSLARYKCPETFELVTELPHTATGKVRRGALRDRSA